jgi:hypothetical protein
MPTISLKNISIEERTSILGNTFFMIRDNDDNQVYFCFENNLRNDWDNLVNNYQNIKEVEVEYLEQERGNKVISLYTFSEETILV